MISLRDELEGRLPDDLTLRIEPAELMRLVFEAVDEVSWPRPLAPLDGATPEPVLRTLIVYCYAAGIFASEEIEEAGRTNFHVQYLCARHLPVFEEIRRFRRHNLARLRETLARVLFAGWAQINPEHCPISFLPFIAEADHRLAIAVEADSATLDD